MSRVVFATTRPGVEHRTECSQNLAAGSHWYKRESLSKGDKPDICTIVKVQRYGKYVFVNYRFEGRKYENTPAGAFFEMFVPADNLHKSVTPTAAPKSEETKARELQAKIRAINWV